MARNVHDTATRSPNATSFETDPARFASPAFSCATNPVNVVNKPGCGINRIESDYGGSIPRAGNQSNIIIHHHPIESAAAGALVLTYTSGVERIFFR
jgi:hypothetical protein